MPATPITVARPGRVRRIKAKPLREWFGMTQAEFARALGVGRRTVARWEATHGGPDPSSAEGKIATDLVEIRSLVTELYGDRGGRAWLRETLPVFDGRTPLDVLISQRASLVLRALQEDRTGAY